MARENQGLQIALIIFVMLTIILGVTTFLFFRQFQEAARSAAENAQKATESDNTARKVQDELNTFKGYAGFAASDTIDAIGEQFRADMDTYVATLPEPQRSYRNALVELAKALQAKSDSLASAQDTIQQQQQTIQQLEASKAPLVAQQQQRAADAEAQLNQARTAYNDARSALEKQQNDQLALFHKTVQRELEEREKLNTQIKAQADQLAALGKVLKEKNDQLIAVIKPTFETPDGKVRWVNQRNRTVWIDLGRADALQRLTSFSVYPADTSDVTKAGKKASIEVTQVLGDHLSEARIVEDEPGNPIIPGDVIHTPVWAPGQREHFALTDGMDIDGDGKSDLKTVLNIITMNGGVVDVYVTDEGERVGEFTNATRYLVMGSEPDVTKSPKARLDARRNIMNDSQQRGLMTITLPALLDKMGWKNVTPVVRYGRDANPMDFRPQPPEGGPPVSTGTVSPLFQPRQMPAGTRGTAY